ncbi:M20/M25/M40 family metallo-hydrolase [Mucilaginibacter auburnensis]|uniref:Zn-dependent M28 family amino/carboxypeptidase n=1 Tax=Mucilaginibacter auburnensis TaxID=1457233 RepID=A0A2H9VQN9_9SPHI|nr:M20/M25/M40 family metallo-hydrolase [Mucilaginibacter auburnensis]PJJ83139.1 Zn-dependent M28 family amino/carboxypeptidase [Mucilaginibacter auburnensis]
MKKLIALISILTLSISTYAQDVDKLIEQKDVARIIQTLAADDMQGRGTFTPGIEKAAQFIEGEFKSIGLKPLEGLNGFRQVVDVKALGQLPTRGNMAEKLNNNPLFNVVGVLPGKSKPDEYVIFSAHYDHLGVVKPVEADSIANGADDDASGTTAVITLAKYFKKLDNNARTIIFVAFTAEEIGGFGARYFSKMVNPDKTVAMFNIEMIGKPSKFGENSAFITGFERSDFGTILQKNLEGTAFKFHPDPYPEQNLFYRSDNATLARLGVPAHTISTDQIDIDKLYHSVKDEFNSLDVKNITATIKAIALSSRGIIAGVETPTRVAKLER